MINSFNKFKRNVYLNLLIKAFVLFIIVFFLDFIIGSLLSKFYFKQKSGEEYQITNAIEKTTADILIFGSSTASHDYYPITFEKRLNMSCYNVGLSGNSIFYDYAVLKAVSKRYTPKIVILNFDVQEFEKELIFYDRLSVLLPYYKKHPEIRSIVALKSPYEQFKLLSNIYPYNSLIFKIAAGNKQSNKKSEDMNGYKPLFNIWTQQIKDCSTSFLVYPLDSNKITIYESFIRECTKRKIQLYIFSCPLFCTPNYISKSTVIGKEIANRYNVKFFDCSKDSVILDNPNFFADTNEHLNDSGAKVYSNKVIDSIAMIEVVRNRRTQNSFRLMNKN